MFRNRLFASVLFTLIISVILGACGPFKKLRGNLKFMERSSIVTVHLSNSETFKNIKGVIIEYESGANIIRSVDYTAVNDLGVFVFFVVSSSNQYVMAYSDQNKNEQYDRGEAAWISSDAQGEAVPVDFDASTHKAKLSGTLSRTAKIPDHLMGDLERFQQGRSRDEVISKLTIPIALGEIGDLDSPQFSAQRGESGLWEPAGFPIHSGIGVYFLERYQPTKTPVLFVYGAAGSPQDWKTFFSKIDRKKYQPWFFYYPTGRRLDEMAEALNTAVKSLYGHYRFERLHVVAHSMGGMVARSFVVKNVEEDHQTYIKKLVTISTPWGGHEAAEMGVKHSPQVVPSWRDMAAGSSFQKKLYAHQLHGKVQHFLIYGNEGKKSLLIPGANDGTVSVASETYAPVFEHATRTLKVHATHTSILSKPGVIRAVEEFLK